LLLSVIGARWSLVHFTVIRTRRITNETHTLCGSASDASLHLLTHTMQFDHGNRVWMKQHFGCIWLYTSLSALQQTIVLPRNPG